MAIAPALFETLCFMLAFRQTGLDDLPPMKPQLSMRPTQDITVTCHLAASMDTHWFINSSLMQVVRNSTGQQDWAVLATLNLSDGKVSASDHLTQSADNFYVVNGTKDRNSLLNISIASVHDTSFCCQVVYWDSGFPKKWRSEAFPFPSNNKTYPGITVTVTEGMSLECFHKPQGTTVTETSLEIVKTETDRDLCPQLEKRNEQHLQRLCRFQNAFVGGAAIKEAHIFNVSQDEGTYQCRISGASDEEMVVTNLITTMTSCCIFALVFGLLFGIPLAIILLLGCIYVSCHKKNNMGERPRTMERPSNMPQDLGLNRVDSISTLQSPVSCTEDQASSSNTEHSPTSAASSDSPPWLSISPPNLPTLYYASFRFCRKWAYVTDIMWWKRCPRKKLQFWWGMEPCRWCVVLKDVGGNGREMTRVLLAAAG